MAIRLKAECSIQLSYDPLSFFFLCPFLTTRSCTPLASLHSTPFLGPATPIVGTTESQTGDFPYPHNDFEFEFETDLVPPPSRPRPASPRLAPPVAVVHLRLDSFSLFVPSNSLRQDRVAVCPFVFFVACFSFFLFPPSLASGNDETRTRDPLHARQVHYQLCYIPWTRVHLHLLCLLRLLCLPSPFVHFRPDPSVVFKTLGSLSRLDGLANPCLLFPLTWVRLP
jgi:hypothetical protein